MKLFRITLVTLLLLGIPLLAFAQPGNPSTPAPLPFILIAAAGVGYGVYKKKKNQA